MGNESAVVALNWSPTPNVPIAPARFPERFRLLFEPPPLLQPASARPAAPAAMSASRRDILYMSSPSNWLTVSSPLPLDRTERDPGDEVPLDEGVDQHDGQDDQHDGHRLDVGGGLREVTGAGARGGRAGGAGDEVPQVHGHRGPDRVIQ